MYIKRLELKNYTSFDSLQLDFSPNINIISGENNIGKTNIIKALYSTTRTIDDIQTENENLDYHCLPGRRWARCWRENW